MPNLCRKLKFMSFVVVGGDQYEIIEDVKFSIDSFYKLHFTKLNRAGKKLMDYPCLLYQTMLGRILRCNSLRKLLKPFTIVVGIRL